MRKICDSACVNTRTRKIKANTVLWEKTVLSTNDVTIDAPVGIEINRLTNNLISPTSLEIIELPPLKSTFINNTLVLEGVISARLLINPQLTGSSGVTIPPIYVNIFIPVSIIITDIRPINIGTLNPVVVENSIVISKSIVAYPVRLDNNTYRLLITVALRTHVTITLPETIDVPVSINTVT